MLFSLCVCYFMILCAFFVLFSPLMALSRQPNCFLSAPLCPTVWLILLDFSFSLLQRGRCKLIKHTLTQGWCLSLHSPGQTDKTTSHLGFFQWGPLFCSTLFPVDLFILIYSYIQYMLHRIHYKWNVHVSLGTCCCVQMLKRSLPLIHFIQSQLISIEVLGGCVSDQPGRLMWHRKPS